MKSKKLLVSIAIVAVVIVVIVVMAAAFSVEQVVTTYHAFDGSLIAVPADGVAKDDIQSLAKGKSIVFLSKSKLIEQFNAEHPDWHAFAVVKNFPNIVEIHLVKRTAILKVDVSGGFVYVDSFGYVTNAPSEGSVVDVSSAFTNRDATNVKVGEVFRFETEENNARLQYILQSILATWQCYVEIADMPEILGSENIFTFDQDGNLLITPRAGGTIKIISPETNLTKRLIAAYGVYYNEKIDMTNGLITVQENGSISSSQN